MHKPENLSDMNDRELLIRIDARTLQTAQDVQELKKNLEDNYVTYSEFKPIKSIVYGAVKVILVTVLCGILYLVVKH